MVARPGIHSSYLIIGNRNLSLTFPFSLQAYDLWTITILHQVGRNSKLPPLLPTSSLTTNNRTVQVHRRNRDVQRNGLAHDPPPPRLTDTHARRRLPRRTRRRVPDRRLRSSRFYPRRVANDHERRQRPSRAPRRRRVLLRDRLRPVLASLEPLRSATRARVLAHAGTRRVRPVARVPRRRRHPARLGALSLRRRARAEEGRGRRAAVDWRGAIWNRVGDRGYLS